MPGERMTTMTTSARRIRRVVRALRSAAVLAGVAALATGCDSLLDSDELPPDVSDPGRIQTPQGAVAAYHGALAQFRGAFAGTHEADSREDAGSFVAITGLLTDELQLSVRIAAPEADVAVDGRAVTEGEQNSTVLAAYSRLQRTRGQTSQAIGLLTRYAPPEQRALTGHAYAVLGYAELFLAELFCSGVPLSTLDFEGDYTYRPGSSTEEVYQHALARFDSALVLAADDLRFVHLARMGQARALLGLGRLPEAATAAAEVPDGYRYELQFNDATGANATNFAAPAQFPHVIWTFTVPDREGGNGLEYRSSGDPRTATTLLGTASGGGEVYHPNKYATTGASPVVLASGVEARLVEAEAALQNGGDWLGILNRLRTDGSFTTQPNPVDTTLTDTLWNAGSGGVAGLKPLEAPADPAAQVDLLFRERAFWLFLTGQRQGDLRRLIRQYGRNPQELYPAGAYPDIPGASYGSDVTLPIPPEERTSNPQFTGCISRGA
jgi:starch-binding outer membrane protein, SusD/RagB family